MRHGKHLQDFRKFLRFSYFLGLKRNASSHLCSAPKASQDWTNAFVSQDDTVEGNSNETGPLSNLNIAIKDNICTKQYKTTCSSAFLQEFSSPYDATVVELLRSSGARIVGKTNCDEFGMGSFNVHSVHGPVINPYSHKTGSEPPSENERRSAGGSSGGSAAAVASGACHAALGTDTGGSIRLPASYCGVTGLKPSYGLISRWGVVSYADSLDCVGILARGVKDINPIFKTLSVYDSKDPTSAHDDVRKKAAYITSTSFPLERSLDGLVIGIPQEYFPEELNQSSIAPLRKLVTELRSAGAKVVPVTLPSTPYALSAYYVIASAEASSNLARYSGIHYGLRIETPEGADKKKVSNVYSHTRSKGFGHEVQKRILLGTYALTADAFDNYFLQAQRVRNLVKDDFNRVFKSPNPLTSSQGEVDPHHKVDVLLHPSAVGIAPLLSEVAQMNALEAYVQDVLTVPASLAGLPALSVPIGTNKDGWPLGASIVGQWGQDEFVLRVGEFIEKLVDFKASN